MQNINNQNNMEYFNNNYNNTNQMYKTPIQQMDPS